MTITPYPLCWPEGWARTPWRDQHAAGDRFGRGVTVDKARRRLLRELRLLGADDVVLSTDLPVRLDGQPYASARYRDSGCAVYFSLDGATAYCMAHDTYQALEHNLTALALALDGLRRMERYASPQMVDRVLTAFQALPGPHAKAAWWEVLDVAPTIGPEALRARYRDLARDLHPDRGGSTDAFQRINEAYREGLREVGRG